MVGRRKVRDIIKEAYEASKALPGMLVESLLKEAVEELEAETWGTELESAQVELVMIERRKDGAVIRKHRTVKKIDPGFLSMNQVRPRDGRTFLVVSGMVKGEQSEVIVDNSEKMPDLTPMSQAEAMMRVSVDKRDKNLEIPRDLKIMVEKVADVATIQAYWRKQKVEEFSVLDKELQDADPVEIRVNDFCSRVGEVCDAHPGAVKNLLSQEIDAMWGRLRR